MNEIIASLHRRKSVRAFEERAVPEQAKRAVLEAALEAPSAGNQQLYTILDITDQGLKEALSVSCDHQPFIAKAPMVLIFCADLLKWLDVFAEGGAAPRRPGCGDLLLAVDDALIAAQNAVTAAESLGLGSCYIGDIMEQCETHRQLLGLPEYVFPAAMLVFGWPTQQQKQREKPKRCRLEDMVQQNTYTRRTGAQLRRMFDKETGHRSFEEWSRAFCQRKYNSDFAVEMSRSVQKYLEEYWQ